MSKKPTSWLGQGTGILNFPETDGCASSKKTYLNLKRVISGVDDGDSLWPEMTWTQKERRKTSGPTAVLHSAAHVWGQEQPAVSNQA